MSSLDGLNYLSFENWNLEAGTVYHFGKEDGLQTNDFIKQAAGKDHFGNIWWGSGKAAVRLLKGNKLVSDIVPQVKLVNMEINSLVVDPKFPSIYKSLELNYDPPTEYDNYPTNLSCTHQSKDFLFRFTTRFSGYRNVKYHCRLSGGTKVWERERDEPYVHYSNLNHGNYTLEIRAAIADKEWLRDLE